MNFLEQRQSIVTYGNNYISYPCLLLSSQGCAIKARCHPVHAKEFLHSLEEIHSLEEMSEFI